MRHRWSYKCSSGNIDHSHRIISVQLLFVAQGTRKGYPYHTRHRIISVQLLSSAALASWLWPKLSPILGPEHLHTLGSSDPGV